MRRYPEYKESAVDWIGKIPVHWQIVRGKFLFCHKKELNSNFQCDNLLSLTLNGVLRKNMFSADGLRPNDYRTYQVFYRDNLVFKLIDLENIQTSRVGIVPEKGIMSPVYIRLQGKGDLCKRYYFYQYYDLYRKHIFNFLGKGVRSSLSPSNLLEIPLVSPPLPEQHAIANFLDLKTQQIDDLIRAKERKIELLQEYRASLIHEAVAKGLDPNAEMKPSGVDWIAEIPKNWNITRLKYVSNIPVTYGLNIESDRYTTEGIRFIRITDIDERGDLRNKGVYLSGNTVPHSQMLDKYDLLLSRSGSTVGKSYLHLKQGEFASAGYLVRFNFGDYWTSKYIYYVTLSQLYRDWIEQQVSIATIKNVNGTKYSNFEIPFPLHQEQKHIANFLDRKTRQIDELRSSEEQTIKLLKEYRQSLISAVVTGKIDVRNEV